MATNFRVKIDDQPTDVHSSHWHFGTEWNTVIPISRGSLPMIWLHRVKIWWT